MSDGLENLPNGNRATAGRLVPAAVSAPALREPYGQIGAYPGDAVEGAPSFGIDLLEYVRFFNRRKWLIASVAVAFMAFGTLRTLMMQPLYTATVRLQIDRTVTKVVEGGNVSPAESGDADFLRTQYALLQSRTMAERVASTLKLGEDADFLKAREFSILDKVLSLLRAPRSSQGTNKTALERSAAAVVFANRAVHPVAGSRLVDVTYSDPVPTRAQKVATAFAEAFIDSTIDKRFLANAYAKTFLEDQIKQLKLRLEESEQEALRFAEKEQIVLVTEKSSIAETNLAAANTALGGVTAERIKNLKLWEQVEAADAISLPQLLSNSVIMDLRAKRSTLETEYQEKLETFKASYPSMVQIRSKIADLDRLLAMEVKAIKASYKAA